MEWTCDTHRKKSDSYINLDGYPQRKLSLATPMEILKENYHLVHQWNSSKKNHLLGH
jgi:hypothetical protein